MLLDEIIAILSDEKGSLNAALLKTKVLLHTLGKKDLATWVSNELTGYPEGGDVPKYRIVSTEAHGHVTNMAWQAPDYVLPIMHLSEQQQKNLTENKCTMSIASIETTIAKGSKLIAHLAPEFNSLFQKVLTPGSQVFSAWCVINMVDVANILTEVRSRLLDFMLELRDAVGVDVPEKELVEKAATVDTEKLFTTAVYGSGHTIIIGNQQHVQAVTNQKDDIEGLIAAIGHLGYQKPELEELRVAVLEDKSKGKTPDVTEGETAKWFTKALKEAGKGVVKAGVDVASSVIVKALKAYATGTP